MRPARLALLSAAFITLAGCADEPVTGIEGVVIDARAARDQVVTGDTVTLTFAVANTSFRDVKLTTGGCLLDGEVRDGAGEVVSLAATGCLTAITTVTIHPGEVIERDILWKADRYDTMGPTAMPLAPGRYRVYPVLHANGEHRRGAYDEITVAAPAASAR